MCDERQLVALTFDDGPSEPTTERILELLAQCGVSASFFVLGKHAATSRGSVLVNRMLEEGHVVGSHSWSHPDETTTAEKYFKELCDTAEVLLDLGVPQPVLHRLPFGVVGKDFQRISAMKRFGVESLGWTIDSEDWRICHDSVEACADRIVRNVIKGVRSCGSGNPVIVLAHDGSPFGAPRNGSSLVYALRDVVIRLLGTKATFVTADKLSKIARTHAMVRSGWSAT